MLSPGQAAPAGGITLKVVALVPVSGERVTDPALGVPGGRAAAIAIGITAVATTIAATPNERPFSLEDILFTGVSAFPFGALRAGAGGQTGLPTRARIVDARRCCSRAGAGCDRSTTHSRPLLHSAGHVGEGLGRVFRT